MQLLSGNERIKMNRRQFLYGTTAAAMPVLGGCGGDEPVVSIDDSYPVGRYGAASTAEEVTLGLDLTRKDGHGYWL